ncbi:DNA cytosine methyltransferase [Rhizobium miluonense]|uniref:Cytosine-specific methyltransferase n=1 Tax=Rhizobium miluonense TaxID=411945 RepID=A0A1C3UD70_9HYPH|nr:DNA (cytosine-5-)-methyltransferase [Rhizobium miluonense]SCB13430.1 DNA-methyltransferase (dcm) [Rhizobium miluonense]
MSIEVIEETVNERSASARDRYNAWFSQVDRETLSDAKKKIMRTRARMTKAMFEMFEIAEAFRAESGIPAQHIDTWLHEECGLEHDQISVAQAHKKMSEEAQATIRVRCVPFETLKALSRAGGKTQREALLRIEDGQVIDATEIRLISKKLANRAASDWRENFKLRKRMVDRAVRQQGTLAIRELEDVVGRLHDRLSEYVNKRNRRASAEGNEGLRGGGPDITWIIQDARDACDLFTALFPGPYGAEEDIGTLLIDDFENGVKSACFYALDDLANGDFYVEDGILKLGCEISPGTVTTFLSRNKAHGNQLTRFSVRPVKTLQAIELCAGAGGEAIGLCASGFEPVLLVDNGLRASQTLKANRPDWNVSRLNLKTCNIEEEFAKYNGKVDLVSGGVPCQPLSRAGSREGELDKRNLFNEAIEIVGAVRPRAFFFENVTGLNDDDHIKMRLGNYSQLKDLGYFISTFVINALDWGLPQNRERVITYGFARSHDFAAFDVPTPVDGLSQATFETVADVLFPYLSGAPWCKPDGEEFSEEAQEQYDRWANAWLGEYKARHTPTVVNWPIRRKPILKQWEERGIAFNDLRPSPPRPGEITKADIKKPLVPITISLLKRLQGIPDDWEFAPDAGLAAQARLIGNAFPPVLARMIGHRIHAVLSGEEISLDEAMKDQVRKPMARAAPDGTVQFPNDPRRQKAEESRQRLRERNRAIAEEYYASFELSDKDRYHLDDGDDDHPDDSSVEQLERVGASMRRAFERKRTEADIKFDASGLESIRARNA